MRVFIRDIRAIRGENGQPELTTDFTDFRDENVGTQAPLWFVQ
jgi:hypothetical protein